MARRILAPAPTPVLDPLPPKRKWQAITLATLLLVPGYWALLAALVHEASRQQHGGAAVAGAVAFVLGLVPFAFIVLAVVSGQPRWPTTVLKAMGMSLLVGIPASALAADAVTGIVAGLGAGGIWALRADADHSRRARVAAVLVVTVYSFVLVRTASALALLPAPVFPFTAIGIADHFSERRAARERQASPT